MKSLTLSPTNKLGVFSVMLLDGYSQRCIGRFNEVSGTFTTFRSEAKHLHRNTNSLAINEAVLNELPIRWIEILYTDASGRLQSLKTSKEYLIKFGKRVAFAQTNFEVQYFLELDKWNLAAAQRYEKQLNSQPSLFAQ